MIRAFKVNTSSLLVVDESINLAVAIVDVPATSFCTSHVISVGEPTDVSNHEEIELPDLALLGSIQNLVTAGQTMNDKALGVILNQKIYAQLNP